MLYLTIAVTISLVLQAIMLCVLFDMRGGLLRIGEGIIKRAKEGKD